MILWPKKQQYFTNLWLHKSVKVLNEWLKYINSKNKYKKTSKKMIGQLENKLITLIATLCLTKCLKEKQNVK